MCLLALLLSLLGRQMLELSDSPGEIEREADDCREGEGVLKRGQDSIKRTDETRGGMSKAGWTRLGGCTSDFHTTTVICQEAGTVKETVSV